MNVHQKQKFDRAALINVKNASLSINYPSDLPKALT